MEHAGESCEPHEYAEPRMFGTRTERVRLIKDVLSNVQNQNPLFFSLNMWYNIRKSRRR